MLLLLVFHLGHFCQRASPKPGSWMSARGLAILVRTCHHTLLYDTGPRFGDFDLGERVVLPTLRKLGVNGLDLMLISHADADHAGGARAVANGLPVKQVLSGDPLALPAELRAEACEWPAMDLGRREVPALATASARTAIKSPACCRSKPWVSEYY